MHGIDRVKYVIKKMIVIPSPWASGNKKGHRNIGINLILVYTITRSKERKVLH